MSTKQDVLVKNGIVIPAQEIEITASGSGGPGGQHVNKTATKITIHWNVTTTAALNEIQKERVLKNLESKLTADGILVISNSSTRSQLQNKKKALEILAKTVSKALYVPKRRMKTRVPKNIKESRLREKKRKGDIKKMRSKKFHND